ncbi:hypothetical protein [Listeria fleischmannii]|uniref:hypothetical protein n=1 Tax=Listeria fleischmannii TaxID=1069827 RepID=UPI001CB75F1A|nr:hypothetical protein [Listeria fleischmannii]
MVRKELGGDDLYSLFEQEKIVKTEMIFTLLNAMNLKKVVLIQYAQNKSSELIPIFIDMQNEIVQFYDTKKELQMFHFKQIKHCSIIN